jgi:hypothetical protein
VAFSQNAHITFSNKSYAGDTLYVLKEKDFITNSMDTLTASRVDNNGQWNVTVLCKSPMLIHIPLYLFEAWLYVEPNSSYQIKIPNRHFMSVEDSLNAYFNPVIIYPLVMNCDSSITHTAISSFDAYYNSFIEKNVRNIHFKVKRNFIDSAVLRFKSAYSYATSSYFNHYMFYKLVLIKYLSYERDQNYVIKYYFNDKPVLLSNTAYMDLFNQLFADYFSYIRETSWGDAISDNIAKGKSPYEIRSTLKHNPALTNDTLIDLIILKGLNDACNDNNEVQKVSFPKKQVLMTLDSMKLIAKTAALRAIAQNIEQKISSNNIMYSYDDIPFKSLSGEDLMLRNFKGNYLYVCVHDFRSYDFITDQKLIKANLATIQNKLKIITVVLYPKVNQLIEMTKKENLDWTFVTNGKPDELKKMMQIKAFPSYYLFDPDGKLLNKNAPPPNAGFVPYFMQILENKQLKDKR